MQCEANHLSCCSGIEFACQSNRLTRIAMPCGMKHPGSTPTLQTRVEAKPLAKRLQAALAWTRRANAPTQYEMEVMSGSMPGVRAKRIIVESECGSLRVSLMFCTGNRKCNVFFCKKQRRSHMISICFCSLSESKADTGSTHFQKSECGS